jgi:hypothetical protein
VFGENFLLNGEIDGWKLHGREIAMMFEAQKLGDSVPQDAFGRTGCDVAKGLKNMALEEVRNVNQSLGSQRGVKSAPQSLKIHRSALPGDSWASAA